jgi:competence protein ComFB
VSLADRYHFDSLTNEAEALVIEEMSRQIPRHRDLCRCEECILDVAAYALNKVRPRYRVSLLDTVFAEQQERSAYLREVRRAVAEAILKVKTNPSHD